MDIDIKEKAAQGFINGSDLEFKNISSEKFREYTFPNGNIYRIDGPIALHVSKSGGHRVICDNGKCHYVQPREGWAIRWTVKNGSSHILF